MKLQLVAFVTLACLMLSSIDAKPTNSDDQKEPCTLGTTFKMECNTCTCTNEGLVCTKRLCVPEDKEDEAKAAAAAAAESKPEDGKASETKPEDAKASESKPEETKEEEKKEEMMGDEAKADDGAAAVQTKPLDLEDDNADSETCTPGRSFKKACNVCTCPPNGLKASGVCTLKACLD